jgi:hypothetical protein
MAVLSAISYFMPIFAFMLVFIVVYAVLKTSDILGKSEAVLIAISFILASFFIVEVSLVDFITFSSAWFATLLIAVFLLVLMVALVPGIDLKKFFADARLASVLAVLIIIIFIVSSMYVFNWAINWGTVTDWVDTEWFGMILLLVIAGVVSWRITKG